MSVFLELGVGVARLSRTGKVSREFHLCYFFVFPKGLPVRMHYMYPVLAWYTREKDLKGQWRFWFLV